MSQEAPLYTTRERVVILLKVLGFFGPLFLLSWLWLLPWLDEYTATANCQFYGELTGVHLLLYGVFVAAPLSLALVILLFEGPRSLRVLRLGQNPLPGEKVLRRTLYRYGWRARLKPLALLACVLVIIGFSVWGGYQASALTATVAPCESSAREP